MGSIKSVYVIFYSLKKKEIRFILFIKKSYYVYNDCDLIVENKHRLIKISMQVTFFFLFGRRQTSIVLLHTYIHRAK